MDDQVAVYIYLYQYQKHSKLLLHSLVLDSHLILILYS